MRKKSPPRASASADPSELAIVTHAPAIERWLVGQLRGRDKLQHLLGVFLERWRAGGGADRGKLDLDQLAAALEPEYSAFSPKRKERFKSRVTTLVNVLRNLLRGVTFSEGGWMFQFELTKRHYVFSVTATPDRFAHLRRFWACHLKRDVMQDPGTADAQVDSAGVAMSRRKASIAVGVFARLFFRIRTTAGDDVYVRDARVNTKASVKTNSSILAGLVRKYDHSDTARVDEIYQYVSAGEVTGSFKVMETFTALGARVSGARFEAHNPPGNAVVLGPGIEPQRVAMPDGPCEVVPGGVKVNRELKEDVAGTLSSRFRQPEMAHVLVRRWFDSGRLNATTSIYSSSSAAVAGVCKVLSDDHTARVILEGIPDPWRDEDLVFTNLVFRVNLKEVRDQVESETVSLMDAAGAFAQIFP
jgi:hypothetical protein